MQGEINRLRLAAEALDNVMANRSPLDTDAAHALKVAKMAKKLDSEAISSMNRLGEVYRAGKQDVQKRIEQKIDLRPSAHAQEIRQRLAAMPDQARMKQLGEWIDENNGPAMAAVLKADAFLSGLGKDQQAILEKSLISKHAGAELDELAAIDFVTEEGFSATQIAMGFAKELTDPNEVARIERQAAAADAAAGNFDQSLQPPV